MPLFKRFVQVGRVALVNYGPDAGKLCVIVDVIDLNRVLVDGPSDITGVPRQALKTNYLSLTDIVLPISHGARLKTVRKAFQAAKVQEKWAATSQAKKLALASKRAQLSDFDRFKVRSAQKKRRVVVGTALAKLKKEHNINAQKKKDFVSIIPNASN